MQEVQDMDQAVDLVLEILGKEIILGTPLGVGKANTFINTLYRRAEKDNTINLTILTALTLQKPVPQSDLEKRFLEPFIERVFGNYPDLLYEAARVKEKLPANIKVIEFYFPPGKFIHNSTEQQNYLSTNYTHAARDVINRGINLLCQQVCSDEVAGETVYSLSCNPDISIDIAQAVRKTERPFMMVGQVNQELPFMYGESIQRSDFFDIIIDNRDYDFKVFGPPKMSVSDTDYMIALHASTLVKDDGEIQIGIGSLGDALVYSLNLRHENNELYQEILTSLSINHDSFPIITKDGETNTFNKGLFAATEMFVDSFTHLYRAGILKKKVYDHVVIQRLLNEEKITEEIPENILDLLAQEKAIHTQLSNDDITFLKDFGILKPEVEWHDGELQLPSGERVTANLLDQTSSQKIRTEALGTKLRNGAVAHAGFFLGPSSFYQFLKDLPVAERKLIRMKKISQINQLYGHEEIDRLQRKNGRFINTCMMVTLNGSACSDALDNGAQVSGVGGQYNFVAMAHELPDARSILQLRSVRTNSQGEVKSNIMFRYGNCTIPRHLRDVVITEYGIADLRGKTDSEVAIQLIQIADSRFQDLLIAQAKTAGKIPRNFELAARFRNNYPEIYQMRLKGFKSKNIFPDFPFGHEFTAEELKLAKILKKLKSITQNKLEMMTFVPQALMIKNYPDKIKPLIERMGLTQAKGPKQKLYQKMLIKACMDWG